ncbi:MAG: carboxymuconolactone decarboxylase family protein [Hyphomonadaceae bacterium]|nr:carboxymuconolactone decarboxylase family protein [Hyphomonadaceae bacterium]
MARIAYFDPAEATGRARDWYARLPPLNIFRMMGHAGELLDGFVRMGNQILAFTKLDPILREIAIVRVGVLSNAAYEVHQHVAISRRLGMAEATIAAIHEGPDAAAFTGLERMVMRFTDDVVANVRAGDATFQPLQAHLSTQELQELTLTVGYYMMVCRFLETFDVDIEAQSVPLNFPGAKASP